MNSQLYDKLIFEYSKPGRQGFSLPARDCSAALDAIPAGLRRQEAPRLPEVDDPTLSLRHI